MRQQPVKVRFTSSSSQYFSSSPTAARRVTAAGALAVLVVIAVACATHARAAAAMPQPTFGQQPMLQQLAFMTGCWRGSITGGFMEEYYSTPTSNMMLGLTRYVRGGRTVDWEFTRIELRDSTIVLNPQPKGGPPTPFRLTSSDGAAATWENPQHDFPQRILYRRQGADSLVAAIEGPGQNGATRRIEWRMGRVRCGEEG